MSSEASARIGSLRDVMRAIGRHRWKVLSFVTLTIAATVSIVLWYPRKYRSEAELFVRVGRESVALDPTATTGQTVQMLGSREHEINSTVKMLQSRALAETVVDRLGAEAVLTGGEETDGKETLWVAAALGDVLDQAGEMVANVDPLDERERAVIKLQKSLRVESPRNTSVVNVSYFDKSPRRAQRIAESVLQAYMEEHVRIYRTAGSREFFDDQARIMHGQWDDAAQELRRTKNQLGLVSIEVQRNLLAQEISRLESQLAESTTSQAATEARVKEIEHLIETTPARMVVSEEEGFPNEALDAMRQSLYTLEIRERELLTKFTEKHPQVIALRDQVAQAREILAQQDQRRTRSTTAPNPAREKLDLDLVAAKTEAGSLAARTAQLTAELARSRAKIETLNDNQVLIAKLEQDVESAHRNYLAHAEKLEQARIDGALEEDRISNVNIMQSPSLEAKPVSPRKGLVAAAGLALALVGSIVIVLIGEQTDRRLRSTSDVERRLDLPVLVSLPRAAGHRVTMNGN